MNDKITALIVTHDDDKTDRLRTSFSALAGFDVTVEPASFADCVDKLRTSAADVAIIFLDEQRGGAGTLILEQLKGVRENLFAFAVSSERSAEVIVKAIRAGADELLSTIPSSEELLKACVKIAERRRSAGSRHSGASKIIAVYSPHGGVGTTTLAVNLSTALRARSDQEVALVDLDLQCGETPVFLDYKPLYTILDVCQGISNLDHAFMKGALYTHSSGLQVLSPPFNLEDSEAIGAAEVEKILDTLRVMYPFVVVDTSSYLNETTFVALEKADVVYLVTDNMVSSVRAVQRVMDTVTRLGLNPNAFELVLNKQVPRSEISAKDVSEALRKEISYVLPLDEASAVAAANQGQPLAKINARSPLVEAIEKIAVAEAGVAAGGQGRGLFGRFFSEARP